MNDESPKKEILGVDLPDQPPKAKQPSALIDVVENLIRAHWENSEMKKYLKAIENKEAVTGSVEWDRAKAAEAIVEFAVEAGLSDLFDGVVMTKVRTAVNRAMNRMDYGTQQRLERRKLLEEQQPPEEQSQPPINE
jgi:hypothetical protein